MVSRFSALQTKRKPIHKALLAIDVENDPITGKFINAGLYGYVKDTHSKERLIDKVITNQKEFTDFLLNLKRKEDKNIPCKLVFFNLSYDYWFMTGICNDARMLSSGTRIITGELENGIPMLDLTNHVDGSLEDWIGYLKMEEKFGIYKPDLSDLTLRVKMDVRATYELAHYLEDFYVYQLGIPFKLTVASAARYLFALHFFDEKWYRPDNRQWLNNYEREGYRGGRTEVFKRGLRKVVSYDVNSMYLNVMHKAMLPNPNTAKYHKKDFDINMDKIFLADVTVEVPKQKIPPLPFSVNKKLIFPTGTFRGKFYSPELVYAVKNCGVKILKVHSYVTYESSLSFRKYAAFIWEKRKQAKAEKNTGMDKLIKKLGNSLYGGFGQRNVSWSYFGKAKDFSGVVGENMTPIISKIDGVDYISVGCSDKEDSQHTFPCIPAFITSYARKDLLVSLKNNEEDAVYCDTDSNKIEVTETTQHQMNEGDELGEWGFEYEKEQIFYKPKMYADKCKGVSKRAELVYEDETSRTYVYKRPNRMKESFRRGLTPNKWEYTVKEVSLIDEKRVWDGLESRPIHIVQ
jgi:hypothetical protein